MLQQHSTTSRQSNKKLFIYWIDDNDSIVRTASMTESEAQKELKKYLDDGFDAWVSK